jgi:hypothetical protein
MTTQRTFKQRVRARMTRTGESYTAARRMLIAAGDSPEPISDDWQRPVSDQAVQEATGRGWQDWIHLLDSAGAAGWTHTQIAAWLRERHEVDGWWAQSVTVGYERATGRRAPGQQADGWSIGATRTIGVPVGRLYEAVTIDAQRERWLPGAQMRLRTATAPRGARYDWEDGETRVVIAFDDLDSGRSRISIQHERLPDADTAEEMKRWWRERVAELKSSLESGPAEARPTS